MTPQEMESQTQEIGRRLLGRMARRHRLRFKENFIARMMEASMRDEEVRGSVLRFVDLLPALKEDGEVIRLLKEHLLPVRGRLPNRIRSGIFLATLPFLPTPLRAWAVRRGVEMVARTFIAATNFRETVDAVRRLGKKGWQATFDVLGEVVTSDKLAQTYRDHLCQVMRELKAGGVRDINIAVKFSAFDSQLDPANWEGSRHKIRSSFEKVLEVARETGAFVWVDPEKYDDLELTMEVFFQTLGKGGPFGKTDQVGIGLQSYLKDSDRRARRLIDWAKDRGTPVGVRLIKGAYWDYEVMHAAQMGWEIPVFTEKWQSDERFERLVDLLIENSRALFVAFGTHNARSVAYAMAKAAERGLQDKVEFQALYGMADRLKEAIVGEGFRLRVYTPFTTDNQYIPGMAYLGRRILENTSQESFLRQAAGNLDPEELLRAPSPSRTSSPVPQIAIDPAWEGYRPASFTNFALVENRQRFAHSLSQESVSRITFDSKGELEEKIGRAVKSFSTWSRTVPQRRAEILLEAARLLEARRDRFAAWVVKEGGKSWREADADVVEAIEAIRFAAIDLLRLEREGYLVVYQPVGPTAVISPWNFPLAILTIGVSAALAAGNTVLAKPAEQTPFVGERLVELFYEAGIPPGALHFVGGDADAGRALVEHPEIAAVVFTGSERVGREIYQQSWRKRVVSEMGGKNAIIVSPTADLDEAVVGVIESAFGHSGQKCSACSRVIVPKGIYREFVDKLVEAARSLRVGSAEDPASRVVPLIDEESAARVRNYVQRAPEWGRVLLNGSGVTSEWPRLVGPSLVGSVDPSCELAQTEVFGPVLAMIESGGDLDEMLSVANQTRYGLTGGIFTRSPSERSRAIRTFRVGNLYVNQRITGARIGVQPFGGYKSSGTGSKTGGPDYLLNFMKPIPKESARWIGRGDSAGEGRDPVLLEWRRALIRAVRPFQLRGEMEDLFTHLPDYQPAPVQLPGQVNLLKYEPLGDGVLLVGSEAGERDVAQKIAAALATGNRLEVWDLSGPRSMLRKITEEFRKEKELEDFVILKEGVHADQIQSLAVPFVVVAGLASLEALAPVVSVRPELPFLIRLITERVHLRDRASLERFRICRTITVVTARHGHLENFSL